MGHFHNVALLSTRICECGRPVYGRRRKCTKCATIKGKVTKLRDSNRGRNRTGIAAHKPDRAHTRKAKRQNPPFGGPRPVTAYRVRFDKA